MSLILGFGHGELILPEQPPGGASLWLPTFSALTSGMTRSTSTLFTPPFPSEGGENVSEGWGYVWDARHASAPGWFNTDYGPDCIEIYYPDSDVYEEFGDGGGDVYSLAGLNARTLVYAFDIGFDPDYSISTGGEKGPYPVTVSAANPVINFMPIGDWESMNTSDPFHPQFGQFFGMALLPQQTSGSGFDPGYIYQNHPVYIEKGKKQHIEHVLQQNTPGNADGIWLACVEGQLAAEFYDIEFKMGGVETLFDYGRISGVRGGGSSAFPKPEGGQSRFMSRWELYSSTSRVL